MSLFKTQMRVFFIFVLLSLQVCSGIFMLSGKEPVPFVNSVAAANLLPDAGLFEHNHLSFDSPVAGQSGTVVICGGKYATKFHSTADCRGLNNCKGGLHPISVSEARRKGFTSCLICY